MKVAALVSGGKDSILSLLLARRYGHTPVVLVNMCPAVTTHNNSSNSNNNNDDDDVDAHDIDSYMYQTVGHEAIEHVAACMQLPLRRGYVRRGQAKDVSMHYDEHVTRTTAAAATTTTTSASRDGCVHDTASSSTHCDNNNNTNDNNNDDDDEVEALYALLRDVTTEFTDVQAVTSGAILSSYQRHRVEHVCARLGLVSLAYLWQRSGAEVLDMAASLRVTAMLVKTASIGLQPRQLLGTTLDTAAPTLRAMARTYGVHMAGEGGEYETLVLDCPLFAHTRLHVRALRRVIVDDNAYAPCGYAVLSDVTRQDKSADARAADARVLARLTATCGRHGSNDDDDEAFVFASDRMAALPSAARVRAARYGTSPCHSPARQGIYDDDDDATTTTTTTVLDWRQLQQLAAASSSTTTATTEQPRQLADAADTRRGRCVVERVVYCDAASYVARANNDNNNNSNDNGGVDDEATASVAVAAATRDLLRRIDDDVRVHDASRVCAYTVYLSSAHVVRAFRDAYAQHTHWVRPPCCSIVLVAAPTTTTPQDSCACSNNNNNTNTSSNSSKTTLSPRLPMCIRVCCVVASPVRCDVLHAQSRSCWAAAASPAGPYAQAWHVHASSNDNNNNNDDDDDTSASASYLVTAIVLGREPVHGAMATADDLCRYENNNNNICSCHNADGAVTAHTAHATTTTMRSDHESGGDDALTPFAVQFAYSYANCAAYVSYFGKTMADVTHVTVYVTPRAHASVADVLAMWRCCYGGCCTDNNNNNSAGDDTAAAVVVEVVHVDALHESDDAVVGLCVRQVVQRSGGGDDDV